MIAPVALLLCLLLGGCGHSPESKAVGDGARPVPALADMQIPDSWGVAASSGVTPSELSRYREHADGVRDAGRHPVRVTITKTFGNLTSGSPETALVNALEDDLCALLEPGNQALLWLVRTGGGRRRWVFYAATTVEAAGRIKRARELAAARGASFAVEDDPEWEMYREWTPK